MSVSGTSRNWKPTHACFMHFRINLNRQALWLEPCLDYKIGLSFSITSVLTGNRNEATNLACLALGLRYSLDG